MSPRLNLHFRYQPPASSRYASLVRYYNQGDAVTELPRRELVLTALEAYWLPFALEWERRSPEEVRRAARASVYHLQLHVSYLEERFGLAAMPPHARKAPAPAQARDTVGAGGELEDEVDFDFDVDFSGEDAVLDSIL